MNAVSPPPGSEPRKRREWNGIAAIIAAGVGLLALFVSAYTAYIQHQQVRAQVWPYLIVGNDDLNQALTVDNKGPGPAIVRSVQLRIDGKPQRDWNGVLTALGLSSHHFVQTTINQDVLSPGEHLQMLRISDQELWQRFHDGAMNRMAVDVCFCSTLGECWESSNGNIIGPPTMALQLQVKPAAQCPRLPAEEVFNN